MSSSLSHIPPNKRRQLAATLGLFAVLLVAVGLVAATGADTAPIKVFVAIAIVAALLLAMMGWGVAVSVKQDEADQSLDAAVQDVLASSPNRSCDCGHDHNPDELHVTDDPCAQDGHGLECTHSCATCVLATLGPRLSGPREETADAAVTARRPSPGPGGRRPAPTVR